MLGDAPDTALIVLLTLMTALLVMVVVSVTKAETVPAKPEVAVIFRESTKPLVTVVGTLPMATKRNTAPEARLPVVVMGVVLSGKPSPLASA